MGGFTLPWCQPVNEFGFGDRVAKLSEIDASTFATKCPPKAPEVRVVGGGRYYKSNVINVR